MRAFLAGRLDLPQAEAVLGVIDAADREQLDAALGQLAGNVSQPLRQVRDELLNLLADLEAGLDFVEEDIHFIDDATVEMHLRNASQVIAAAAKQMSARHRGAMVSDVVLRGEPNAGKSSLLNALVGESVALVSDRAGTTRDVLWRETTLLGHPVRLIDTAGLEQERDEITRQSQLAARESQKFAAVTLRCVPQGRDPDAEVTAGGSSPVESTSEHRAVVRVATQCDLIDEAKRDELRDQGWLVTSAVTGLGLDALRNRIAAELDLQVTSAELGVSATAARCGDTIARAAQSLQAAQEMLAAQAGHEWVASEIRLALSAIGEIYTDDILDRVFSRFCIGK
jgi:tRNA modification GTPase